MYEPSRVLLSFHIAGFQYADGALVLGDLKVGNKLSLCAERDNPHDPEAVAIYYGKTKLGYVPGNEVGPLSLRLIGQNVCPRWGYRRRSMPLFQPFKFRARF